MTRKKFLTHIGLALNPAKNVEKYREKIKDLNNRKDDLYKKISKQTSQLD
ncbi:MAG: hypothetical protein GY817_02260 [bacterium]|nr:hypothetical protein [bacterium]